MTITLGGVALPVGLQWSDEFNSQAVAQTRKRTLDGSQVVFYSGVDKGRAISLESGSDTGWLTKTQVDAVKVLADSPGGVYSLSIRGQSFSVMFRHEDPPAFEASPLFPYANPSAGDYYLARIRLVTV